MRFHWQGMLWLLALIPALLLIVWQFARWRTERVAKSADPRLLAEFIAMRPLWRRVGFALSLTGLGLVAIALARPQIGKGSKVVRREGIDIVVALDVSKSMLARDVRPSRLARAKLELSAMFDHLKGDRVALVPFAGDAFVSCPLTTDYEVAKLFLKDLDTGSIPQGGTAIGAALETALRLIKESKSKSRSKMILLVTDGEDHDSEALAEADRAAADGVQIHAVGIGSSIGEPIPKIDDRGVQHGYQTDRSGKPIVSRLNEALLRQLAEKTGGKVHFSNAGGLGIDAVLEDIQRMEKAEYEVRVDTDYEDRFVWLLAPAALLLAIGAFLGDFDARRLKRAATAKPEVRHAA